MATDFCEYLVNCQAINPFVTFLGVVAAPGRRDYHAPKELVLVKSLLPCAVASYGILFLHVWVHR